MKQIGQFECKIEFVSSQEEKLDKDNQEQLDTLEKFLERHL